jgi:hypothetical protein
MPRVQNREHAYHQRIAPDTFPCRVLSETTTVLTNNSGPALLALAGKGMPGCKRKVKKIAQF